MHAACAMSTLQRRPRSGRCGSPPRRRITASTAVGEEPCEKVFGLRPVEILHVVQKVLEAQQHGLGAQPGDGIVRENVLQKRWPQLSCGMTGEKVAWCWRRTACWMNAAWYCWLTGTNIRTMLRRRCVPHFGTLLRNAGSSSRCCVKSAFSLLRLSPFKTILGIHPPRGSPDSMPYIPSLRARPNPLHG